MKKYNPMDYVHSTSRVRALENSMLTKADFKKMLEAKTAEDALKVLSDVGVCSDATMENVESAFEKSLFDAYALVDQITKLPVLSRIFRHVYDGLNLKIMIKTQRLESDRNELYSSLGNISADVLKKEFKSGKIASIHPMLAKEAEKANSLFAKSGDPQLVDLYVDKGVLTAMKADADELDHDFVSKYIRLFLDIANVRTSVRMARMKKPVSAVSDCLVEGGNVSVRDILETYPKGFSELIDMLAKNDKISALSDALTALVKGGTLSDFERICDNTLESQLEEAKKITFGIEPVVAYLCAKELEVKTARTILSSKLAGVPAAQIENRMRNTFV